jgi:hypothetical protein
MGTATVRRGAGAAPPSEELAKAAAAPVVLTDGSGRKITLVKPSVLAEFRLVKIMGPELAANTTYMQMILPLIYVQSINDEAVPFPQSDRNVEALITRLGEDGIAAVMSAMMKHFAHRPLDEVQAEIKN